MRRRGREEEMKDSSSRKLLVAYNELVQKDKEKTNVTQLCKRAGVSRAAFYLNYKDIDEYVFDLRKHIIMLLFEQASRLISCSDLELRNAVKKENLLFSDEEISILSYMISGSNYISFATLADLCYDFEEDTSPIPVGLWKYHRDELDLFTRGYLLILIYGLIDYEETVFRSDIMNCRKYFKALCEQFENQDL